MGVQIGLVFLEILFGEMLELCWGILLLVRGKDLIFILEEK